MTENKTHVTPIPYSWSAISAWLEKYGIHHYSQSDFIELGDDIDKLIMRVATASINPGDIVVIKTKEMIDDETRSIITKHLKNIFHEDKIGFPVQVIILDGGMELEIVKPELKGDKNGC